MSAARACDDWLLGRVFAPFARWNARRTGHGSYAVGQAMLDCGMVLMICGEVLGMMTPPYRMASLLLHVLISAMWLLAWDYYGLTLSLLSKTPLGSQYAREMEYTTRLIGLTTVTLLLLLTLLGAAVSVIFLAGIVMFVVHLYFRACDADLSRPLS